MIYDRLFSTLDLDVSSKKVARRDIAGTALSGVAGAAGGAIIARAIAKKRLAKQGIYPGDPEYKSKLRKAMLAGAAGGGLAGAGASLAYKNYKNNKNMAALMKTGGLDPNNAEDKKLFISHMTGGASDKDSIVNRYKIGRGVTSMLKVGDKLNKDSNIDTIRISKDGTTNTVDRATYLNALHNIKQHLN